MEQDIRKTIKFLPITLITNYLLPDSLSPTFNLWLENGMCPHFENDKLGSYRSTDAVHLVSMGRER